VLTVQINYEHYVTKMRIKSKIEDYARVLYNNYRVRSGQKLPVWNRASVYVRREFIQEARQILGY
jgi:hypothetical protein